MTPKRLLMTMLLAQSSVLFLAVLTTPLPAADPVLPETVDFNRDIRPILSNLCYHCHGPDKTKRQADLRFDTREGVFAKRDDLTVTVPGKPAQSEIYRRITTKDAAERMPPDDSGLSLTPHQAQLIQRWILQGASWQAHWSFSPPVRPSLPDVSQPDWPTNAIDHFILARLDKAGLSPSPPANPTTLLRRLHLDLTGLPPTPAQISRYLADDTPAAYEREVERLLNSPRLGEHLAARWLDAARYADTSGYQNDGPRDMWRWRDWVLDSLNTNMPFDRFTIEQLAGDLLPNATLEQRIATGFNRNHRGNSEGGVIPEEFQVEYVVDRVDTTATVWLGLTLNCARCHEHKYDPFSQKEFYRLFAYFNNLPENGRAIKEGNSPPLIKAPTPAQQVQQLSLAKAVTDARRTALKLRPLLAMSQRKWEAADASKLPEGTDWSVTSGLVAHFAFDQTLSDATDAKRTGKFSDPAAYGPGRLRHAAKLSGGGFVEVDETPTGFGYRDHFTLSAWIRPDRVDRGTVLSRMTDVVEGKGYYVDFEKGHIRVNLITRWLDDSIRVQSARPITAGNWRHLAVTYDGTRLAKGIHLFLDGRPVPLTVNYDFINQSFESNEPLRLGGGGGAEGRFEGLLDEVRIYDRDLSAAEVSVLATPQTIPELVSIPRDRRTPGQVAKLRDYFTAKHATPLHRHAVTSLRGLLQQQRTFLEELPTVMVMQELPKPRPTFILQRGEYDRPGQRVTPGTPPALPPLPANAAPNRLTLARWLVNKKNPLTARVICNRFWQGIYGSGLVRTTEDFGSQGEQPSHPQLLDWLATEFHDSDWNVKSLLRTLVTSATYRQSSRLTKTLLETDPLNRLLARAPRYRLSAEVVRDQALFTAGLLNERIGGPSVRPYQPKGLWKEIASTTDYNQSHGGDLYRRSLYTYWKRTVTHPTMLAFDASTREACTVRPARTNTPLQALTLMNDITFAEAARTLAERILSESAPANATRLRQAFLLTVARPPRPEEQTILLESLTRQRAAFAANPEAASQLAATGESPRRKGLNDIDVAAWTTLASLLLNLDETISRE